MDEIRKLEAMVALNEALEGLVNIRMGAQLTLARPDLGRFLVELTSPSVPSNASEEFSDCAVRLVAADDNFLQTLIDTLTDIQRRLGED